MTMSVHEKATLAHAQTILKGIKSLITDERSTKNPCRSGGFCSVIFLGIPDSRIKPS